MNLFFKQTTPGGQLLALLLIFVVFFIIGTGISVVPVLFGYDTTNLVSQALSQIVVFACSALFFSYLFHGSIAAPLQLAMPHSPARSFWGSFFVLVLVLPASDWLSMLNDSWHFPESLAALERVFRELSDTAQQLMEQFLLRGGIGDLLANLLVLALVPAVCEEIFFRGALQQTLTRCFGGRHHAAIIVTAAIFSLMHGDLFAFLPRFLLGILLGYLFFYGHSLWVNALAHFVNNTFVVILYFLAAHGIIDVEMAESLNLPFIVVLATAIACAALFWFFFLRRKKEE